jgi:hypothetical protein
MLGLNKQLASNPYMAMTKEDIEAILGVTSNPQVIAQCKEALVSKDQPEAYVTVQFTKNHKPKPVYNTKKELLGYRLTGKLIKVKTVNYDGEITFGFGAIKDTAKLTIFVFVDEYTLSDMSFGQGQHATFKVAFSQHPTTETSYILQASTIQTLKKHPETGDTNPVWVKGKKQEIAEECPGEGWTAHMSNIYSEVKAEQLVDSVVVNAASANSIVPADPLAWLKQGEENQAEVDAHNLAQWTASRAKDNSKNETSDGDKTAEETLKEESEVNV